MNHHRLTVEIGIRRGYIIPPASIVDDAKRIVAKAIEMGWATIPTPPPKPDRAEASIRIRELRARGVCWHEIAMMEQMSISAVTRLSKQP